MFVGVIVVNAAYYFHSRPLEAAEVEFISSYTPSHVNEVMFSLRTFSKVVPTDFLYGIYMVLVHNRKGHPASLLGMHSEHGWWYYFPVAFALKTTLPFLLLSVAALLWFLNGSSAQFLRGPNSFAEYRQRTPEVVFGNSIYLYRVRE